MTSYDAVVVAGGRAQRLGGADKPGLSLGGRPLVAVVVDAVGDAARVVLVGPDRPGVRADVTTREDPPGSGPVAAIAAGLAHVTAGRVAVLAGDLPFLTADAVRTLLTGLDADDRLDAVVAVDDTGKDQLLLSVWRTDVLRDVLAEVAPHDGVAVRRLYANVRLGRHPLAVTGGTPPPWFDCDTPDDLHAARGWA